eukprot:10441795-Alexandrium_andersonii.AAC.1
MAGRLLGTTPPIGGATEACRRVLSAPQRVLLITVRIVSCVRTWTCAGPGTASKLPPEAQTKRVGGRA